MTETPDPKERRLVLRLLGYWRELCGVREYPELGDIDGTEIPDIWPNCFIIAVDGEVPRFTYLGEWHREFYGEDMTGCAVPAVGDATLLAHAVDFIDQVLARRVPVTHGGEFVDLHGRKILYRSILMPLGLIGADPVALLGGANCKIDDE